MNRWSEKRVLITGVCGTIGKEILVQLTRHNPVEIIGIDNNESEIFFLTEEFKAHDNVRLFVGDVRDIHAISRFKGIDVILHTAAYKHVYLCEESPRDAIQTNILGTQNIIESAMMNQVERVIFTSSDKAVNPTSVMGTSKLMGERLLSAANLLRRGDRPIFAATRFGNVLGSRGSVIPLFKKQIAGGGPITLTHPDMTRFIMSLREAVQLVMDSVFLARGGEVFVTKMPVVRIRDLAQVMIEELAPVYGLDPSAIELQIVGTRPGEKMYEELINHEEIRRSMELENYFVVVPALKSMYNQISYSYAGSISQQVDSPYNSTNETPMNQEEIRHYLAQHELL